MSFLRFDDGLIRWRCLDALMSLLHSGGVGTAALAIRYQTLFSRKEIGNDRDQGSPSPSIGKGFLKVIFDWLRTFMLS
jgi:hypothetical protein